MKNYDLKLALPMLKDILIGCAERCNEEDSASLLLEVERLNQIDPENLSDEDKRYLKRNLSEILSIMKGAADGLVMEG